MLDTVEQFMAALASSLSDGTFVKMTLGNYKGGDEHLQKIHVRQILVKGKPRLFFLYRYNTRDTAKNYDFDEGCSLIGKMLDREFCSGHLFTTRNDFQLDIGKKGRSRLNTAKPTFKTAPALEHDRQKKLQIDPDAFYLRALGITTDQGEIRTQQHDKWRQINKFVEVLASLFDKSELKDRTELKIVDMGSGKGYLTFAAYDYFQNTRGVATTVTGVEARQDLVGLCNDVARAAEFDGLTFVNGTIDSFDPGGVDILIALHACNMATDDAIYKGIVANAGLIVAAPCCHQEIRPQLKPPAMFRDILKHGVMLERVAETVTDGLRSLLLERSGYLAKLFEFISVEHTPKNNMLVGTRLTNPPAPDRFDEQIRFVKEFYGIEHQRLETLLNTGRSASN
jgi:SAM-dependent methyltransferase